MISIIIPVFNVELYLRKCIESILVQSYTDYEVLLIDDGSTDSSGKICDSFLSNEHFKIVHQQNQGVSAARNKGLSISDGEYILFVDPDDWIAEDTLEVLMNEVKGFDLLMFGYFEVYNSTTERILRKINFIRKPSQFCIVQDPFYEILGCSGIMCNKLFRRSVIGDICFDTKMTYGEDMVFVAKVLEKVHSAKIISNHLYYYFINRPGNVVSSLIDSKSIEFLKNTKLLYAICKNNHRAAVGARRVIVSLDIVMANIAASVRPIKEFNTCFLECESLLYSPSFTDWFSYFADRNFSFRGKVKAILLLILGRHYARIKRFKYHMIHIP